jgi:hypothetical protein
MAHFDLAESGADGDSDTRRRGTWGVYVSRVRASNKIVTAASAGLLVAATVLSQAAEVASATAASAGHPQRVIVIMRDQLRSTPVGKGAAPMAARTDRARRSQATVLARISGPAAHNVVHYSVANAFAATVDAGEAAQLAADPAVAAVVNDAAIPAPARQEAGGGTASAQRVAVRAGAAADGPNAICPTNPAQPLLEPEALRSIRALTTDGSKNAQQITKGNGVTVAYIADGIDPDNPDFIRPNGDHVIIDYKDFSGDGPNAPTGGGEAFGDASAIAAQGTVVHDLSNFVNQSYPLPAGCNIRIVGVAPGASIVALKAGGEFLTNSSILQSIDYAVRVAHVDVINESFGLNQFPDDSNRNTIKLFNDQAVAAGVTVTESTGDGGVTGTIGSDAQDPHVISVAASTDFQSYAQTGYAGAREFGNGHWVDDNISALSSSGFTQRGRTADLVAPGETDWAVCEAGFASCTNFRSPAGPSDVQPFGGTSQSAPLTAGAAALVISAYRAAHNGQSPSPATVKRIITGTAHDLDLPPSEQGSGLLDTRAAVEAATTWPRPARNHPHLKANFVTSRDQQSLKGLPGSTVTGSVRVRNVGQKDLDLATGTRTFQTIAETGQATSFDAQTLPTFPYPVTGVPWAFKKLHFDVPAGAQRLVARMAWAGTTPGEPDRIVRLTLLAPDGTFVANSRPQGGAATANYANIDVRHPASGTWTAVLYSLAGSAGYTGVIGLDTLAQRAIPVGSVTPANVHLAPGQTQKVSYHFTVPRKAAGDQDYAVTLGSSVGQRTVVGVVVRTLIDAAGNGAFTGVVTGGNARGVTPAQTLSYEFDVPDGTPSLDASLSFQHNPNSVMDLVLVDPNGELADVVTNLTPNVQGTSLSISRRIQSFTAHPVPGRWDLVVVAQNPVSGTAFTAPFKGRISFAPVPVDTGGLPNGAGARLNRGHATTYDVTVTNTGVQPILVGADPRTTQFDDLAPVPIQGSTDFDLPPDPSQEPIYVVPPDTNALTVTAQSTTRAQLELQGSAAGMDLFGDLASAQGGNLLSTASLSESGAGNYITRGIWFTNVQEIGPFTDAGQTAGHTWMTASMHTLGFDPTVTSSTDDPYAWAVDPNSDGFGHPVRIPPGQSRVIHVTIRPQARSGAHVTGLLNLVTVSSFPSGFTSLPQVTTGEVVATLPYAYTVD